MSAKLHFNAAPATFVSLAVILALAAAGVVASGSASTARSRASGSRRSAQPASPQPKCGDTITTDVTLHHDLVNCPNNGIVIGADNVTLDLNYHTIDGDGTPAAGCDPRTEFCDVGVVNFGHDGITVVHGSVREFDVGVFVGEARHNRLLGISSSGNRSAGLGFFHGTRSLMRNSSGSGSTSREDGTGMFLADSHHVRILHNSFRRNGDQGIFAPESTHNLIKGNLLSRNRGGIELQKSNRNQVRRNRSVRDGIGVLVALRDARRNVIARNRIVHPTQARGGSGEGIEVPRGSHNVIARNSIRDASQNAIAVGGEGVRGVGNVVRRNHIRGAGKDGVKVGGQAERSLLLGNRVRKSRDDGFDVASRTAKLTRNRAVRNRDLGILAVRGVIDGGGNRASGNGDPRQCTHIMCR
jgi:parallel beta-helix repeat protein